MTFAARKIRPSETQGEVLDRVTVGKTHLDTNSHVNNGQYIAMAADFIPDGMRIRQIRAEYRKQAHLGDVITVRRILLEDGCCICLEQDAKHPYAVVAITSQDG